MLRVNEIFPAIQGEGKSIGQPVVFIRFYGCNCRCPWCIEENILITMADGNTKKAKDVKIGEEVLTPFGPTIIENSSSKKVKKYVKITLKNGETLKCTLDHPLILDNGKQCEAQNLKLTDKVMISK